MSDREDELALLAVADRLAAVRVDDLPQNVVLGDVQPARALALPAHARPHDLGQPVVVGRPDAQTLPRSPALQPREQARRRTDRVGWAVLEVDAHLLAHLGEVEGVGRGRDEHRRPEVLHHHDVALGVAATCGDDRRARCARCRSACPTRR